MTTDLLLQLMRTCKLSGVRRELDKLYIKDRPTYDKLVLLYTRASK